MAFEKLGYDKKNIYAITMPCFGTTSRTKNNALGLIEELGVTSQTVNIAEVVRMQILIKMKMYMMLLMKMFKPVNVLKS